MCEELKGRRISFNPFTLLKLKKNHIYVLTSTKHNLKSYARVTRPLNSTCIQWSGNVICDWIYKNVHVCTNKNIYKYNYCLCVILHKSTVTHGSSVDQLFNE